MGAWVDVDDLAVIPDVAIAAHVHAYITPCLIEATTFGVLGYHPSLLPRHRERDAIRWAIHMREYVTGGTAYWFNERADAGSIATQECCFILPDDTPTTLWQRELAPMGVRLMMQVISDIARGSIKSQPQNENLATWEPAFSRSNLASLVG